MNLKIRDLRHTEQELQKQRDELAEKTQEKLRHLKADDKGYKSESIDNSLEVKTEFDWFDFAKNEVLKVENIIRSCFLNPDRSKFPEAIKYFDLCNEDKDLSYFLNRISKELPSSLKKFDNADMTLYNTNDFWQKTFKRDPINPLEFFEQIKRCKWYGPYSDDEDQIFQFYSLVNTGDN